MLALLRMATIQLSLGALLFSKQKADTKTDKPVFANDKKVAIFSIGHDHDNDALQKIVTGYKLAQQVESGMEESVDWFIAGTFRYPDFFTQNNIKVLELDVEGHGDHWSDNDLGKVKGMPYQHWWSVVPEELAKQGYGLSMWFNATEVVAMRPMKVDDARRTLKRTQAVMAVSTVDWTTYDKPGTLINSGLVWFNNSAAKIHHLFNMYKGFVQYEGQKHREEDYLKKFVSLSNEVGFKSATLNPEWQMVCKKSTPQMKDYYAAGNMPYFVHLGHCRGTDTTLPAKMQLGVPHEAQRKWNDKYGEIMDLIQI